MIPIAYIVSPVSPCTEGPSEALVIRAVIISDHHG